MGHAISSIVLAIALSILGLRAGLWGILLVWLGSGFFVLGLAHLRRFHGVFGKRPDGKIPLWSWFLFFPLLVYTLVTWHLLRLLGREERMHQVSEQLVIGRRLLAREIPGDFVNYVDLTSELPETRVARETPGFLAFPILDASAPEPDALRAAVSRLRPGRTFIHCAQGHGRTGLFALAVLLSSGTVRSVEEGLSLLASARPAIRLSLEQKRCIRAFVGH